jgi:hypothetical protein
MKHTRLTFRCRGRRGRGRERFATVPDSTLRVEMNNLEEPTNPSKKSSSGEEKVSFTTLLYVQW